MAKRVDLTGGCHCGVIAYTLSWPQRDLPIASRSCSCSFCTKHNNRYTSNPDARLKIRLADEERICRYRFATGSADFIFCRRCGVMPLLTAKIEGKLFALVNVNSLDDQSVIAEDVPAMTFEGEDLEERTGRRKKNWISRVEVVRSA